MGWLKGKSLLPTWLVLVGASIAGAGQASACSCSAPPAATLIERADVAFEGEVIDVSRSGISCVFEDLGLRTQSCELRAQLRVLTPLKGQPGEIVMVYTAEYTGACGFGFKKGQRLTIVAWRTRDQRLSTDFCVMTSANR